MRSTVRPRAYPHGPHNSVNTPTVTAHARTGPSTFERYAASMAGSRLLLGAAWVVALVVLLRIASGGSGSPGSVGYALGALPAVVVAWGAGAVAAGFVILHRLARSMPAGKMAAAAAVLVAPLGLVLLALGHSSGGLLALTMLAGGAAAVRMRAQEAG